MFYFRSCLSSDEYLIWMMTVWWRQGRTDHLAHLPFSHWADRAQSQYYLNLTDIYCLRPARRAEAAAYWLIFYYDNGLAQSQVSSQCGSPVSPPPIREDVGVSNCSDGMKQNFLLFCAKRRKNCVKQSVKIPCSYLQVICQKVTADPTYCGL